MNNNEKVLLGLEHCYESGCKDCPYRQYKYTLPKCDYLLMEDAYKLLKSLLDVSNQHNQNI